jgi:hypothetical protein
MDDQITPNTPLLAHELAEILLKLPNVPCYINGWGSDEGLGPFEVTWVNSSNNDKLYFLHKGCWREGLIC